MSHYSVCVITSDGNYEEALSPFNENLEVDEYIAETREELINRQRALNEKRQKDNESKMLTDGKHDVKTSSIALLDEDLLKQYIEENKEWEKFDENGNLLSTYNPNSKWDWYEIGGRYSEKIRLDKSSIPSVLKDKLENLTVQYNVIVSLSKLNLDCIEFDKLTIEQIQKYLNKLVGIFHPDMHKETGIDEKYIKEVNKLKQMIKDNYSNISVFREFEVFTQSLVELEKTKNNIVKELLHTYKQIDPSIKKYISDWSFDEYKLEWDKVDAAKVKFIDFSADPTHEAYYKRFWEIVVEGSPRTPDEDEDKYDSFYNANFYLDKYVTKENYIEQNTNFRTYAYLDHGEWVEPGQMGWFGCSDANSDGYQKYEEDFKHLLKNLYEDDIITIVDCHI